MAVLETIRNFFIPNIFSEPEITVPAPPTQYSIRPLTISHLSQVLKLNLRCFRNGDNYTKYTFDYLLNEPRTLSYRMVTPSNEIVGFAFVMVKERNAAHITTIGVAPEHRRRGIANQLLKHLENALIQREIGTVMLEVRVGNTSAQQLYKRCGYTIVQRINKYYSDGEDCFLMIKSLFV
ncbi:MAG: ribosomal protein S18-alanine N-acetyltransferase [Pyrinomonadaceae bacterium]